MITKTLFHAIRSADGNWPFGFIDVQTQTDPHGAHIFQIDGVACAANRDGDLQVCINNRVAIQ